MKQLIFLFAVTFAIICTSEAAIYRHADNGRDNGTDPTTGDPRDPTYKHVDTYLDNEIIICDDAGAEECPKGLLAPNTPEEQNVNYALDQIYNGVLTGNELRNGLQLEWTATGSNPGDASTIISWDPATESKPTGTP